MNDKNFQALVLALTYQAAVDARAARTASEAILKKIGGAPAEFPGISVGPAEGVRTRAGKAAERVARALTDHSDPESHLQALLDALRGPTQD